MLISAGSPAPGTREDQPCGVDPRCVEELAASVRALGAAASPHDRLGLLRDALDHLVQVERQLVELRDESVIALSEDGWTLQEIAVAHGVTRGRVHQILKARRPAGEDPAPSHVLQRPGSPCDGG